MTLSFAFAASTTTYVLVVYVVIL